MREIVQTIISGATLLAIIFGGFKFYYLLEQHPPHTHIEREKGQHLTTLGIVYPRGTKNGHS